MSKLPRFHFKPQFKRYFRYLIIAGIFVAVWTLAADFYLKRSSGCS